MAVFDKRRIFQRIIIGDMKIFNSMQKKISKLPFKGTPEQEAQLKAVIAEHCHDKSNVMVVMQKAQDIYGYLPIEVQEMIADGMGVPLEKVYGVATFYGNFSLDAKGKYVLKVCRGTACHVRRSDKILEAIYEATGLSESKPTTDDGLFTIETVSCLGACGLSPVVMVNDTVHPQMTPDKARALIEELRTKED